ncbi:hypothetical protein DVS28_a2883 [Euzebya pacifica]|jgi:hypothetical protein|uniref:Uncharacterized protein n=1 Tax=Euzebya pacifica TaxID=1608957 RepID=A0A346XZB5_9ACTN|nr:hypothetical protein [Euzebya pacifica]AXV07562.1 hypothetical protein DVS28_a2883 [Euzebya pacifica]
MSERLDPERPADEDVDATYPDADQQEGVHLLANQAADRLADRGFTREQVFEWAAAYVEREGVGTVDGLIAFIRQKESNDT